MKENRYDDKEFFEKYSQMERSKKGLEGAGEWYQLKELLPNFKGKRVLDLGCGFGWHCIYAAENGAKFVEGIDISKKMLARAKEQTKFTNIKYRCIPLEDIEYESNSFDIVISSLTLHYIENFEEIVKKIYGLLIEGGKFIFSVEHPIFTAQGKQDWYYNKNGEILHWPVDSYYFEGRREAIFLGEKIVKYHRTMTTYIETLLKNGFKINHLIEAQPSLEMLEKFPEIMENELRRPMILLISVEK